MITQYSAQENIPRLAWAAEIQHKRERVTVYHGSDVVTNQNSFFEGAWDGDFSSSKFDEALSFMGSGAVFRDNDILFVTPCHTLERLFVIQEPSKLYISNSLTFCLTLSGNSMDPGFALYQGVYDSITKGFEEYVVEFPLNAGKKIESYVYCNISITSDLYVNIEKKNKAPNFTSFEEYRHFLECSIEALINNANDNRRLTTYASLATASRGYDGAAVAALAKNVGCEEVFTFANGRPKNQVIGKYSANRSMIDDSGETVASQLGYEKIIVKNRWDYLDVNSATYEFEACASGNLWYDPTVVYEKDLRNKMLLTGHFGDVIWGRGASGSQMQKGGISGASLYESRLRIGFIHAPIPYIAATSLSSIIDIANSDEMKPWQLDRYYDRPIPRRIIESQGVAREEFGHKKMAVGVVLAGTKGNFLSKMSEMARKSFDIYYKKARKERSLIKQSYYNFRTFLYVLPIGCAFLASKLKLKLYFSASRNWVSKHWIIYNRNPRAGSYLFPWGVNEVAKRYEIEKSPSK
jgi:hypothetical protein